MARTSRSTVLDLGPDDLDVASRLHDRAVSGTPRSVAAQRGASVRNQTYEALRRAIVQCRIPPNQALSENELSEALDVSRTPVREALLRLAEEGLVVIVPQKGTVTTLISVVQVREAQLVREMLERAALATSHELAQPDAFRELEARIEEQRRASARGDVEAFIALDQQFHAALVSVSGYEALGRIATNARAHLDRIRSLSVSEETRMDVLINEHEHMVKAMIAGDLASADRVLTSHLRRVLDSLPHLRSHHPEFFADEPDVGRSPRLSVTPELPVPGNS